MVTVDRKKQNMVLEHELGPTFRSWDLLVIPFLQEYKLFRMVLAGVHLLFIQRSFTPQQKLLRMLTLNQLKITYQLL